MNCRNRQSERQAPLAVGLVRSPFSFEKEGIRARRKIVYAEN